MTYKTDKLPIRLYILLKLRFSFAKKNVISIRQKFNGSNRGRIDSRTTDGVGLPARKDAGPHHA